jgi:hypothetical protein
MPDSPAMGGTPRDFGWALLRCLCCACLGAVIGSIAGVVLVLIGLSKHDFSGLDWLVLGILVTILGASAGAVAAAGLWKRRTKSPVDRTAAVHAALAVFFSVMFLALFVGCGMLVMHW